MGAPVERLIEGLRRVKGKEPFRPHVPPKSYVLDFPTFQTASTSECPSLRSYLKSTRKRRRCVKEDGTGIAHYPTWRANKRHLINFFYKERIPRLVFIQDNVMEAETHILPSSVEFDDFKPLLSARKFTWHEKLVFPQERGESRAEGIGKEFEGNVKSLFPLDNACILASTAHEYPLTMEELDAVNAVCAKVIGNVQVFIVEDDFACLENEIVFNIACYE